MSEWKELLLAGLTAILGGIGWWVKTRHDDRIARELGYVREIKALQQEVKDLLQDRIRYEMVRRESSDKTMTLLVEVLTLLKTRKGLSP